MIELNHLCPGCFVSGGGSRPCKECGYAGEDDRPRICLPVLATLQGDLVVGRLLGKPGSFGITYLGWDPLLKRKVAIKEYLPRDLAGRDIGDRKVRSHSVEEEGAFSYGLEKFVEEARILAHLDHPNIVRVQRYFQENGTAYLVMDYHAGVSLDQYLEGGKRLPEDEAVALLLPVLEALSYIHARDFVHRDVKPSNVYLKGGRTPILLDFGAARTALGERTKNLSVLLSPGYAPIEQYSTHGQLGPWTDVYALAATLYRMWTGKNPPDANSRFEEDKLEPPDQLVPGLSTRLSRVVLEGLAIKRQDRPKSAEAFAAMLRLALEPAPVIPEQTPSSVAPEPAPTAVAPRPEPSITVPEPPAPTIYKSAPSVGASKPISTTAAPKPAPSTVIPPAPTPAAPKPAPSTTLFKPAPLKAAPKPILSSPAATKPAPQNIAAKPAALKRTTSTVGPKQASRGQKKKLERSRLAPMAAQMSRVRLGGRPFERQWFRYYLVLNGLLILLLGVILLPFMRSDWIYDPKVALVPIRGLQPGEVQRNGRDGLEYAWIPPGEFQMGCTPEVDGPCEKNEGPPHRVVLAHGFWLGTTEVTVEAFRLFPRSERRNIREMMLLREKRPKLPVVYVTWADADEFCRWSGGRLPAEAEWEYAARGGKSQKYPWGNETPVPLKEAPNGAAFTPGKYKPDTDSLAEVGSFGENAFHLSDMAGSVWEWCQDTWYGNYRGAPSDGSAWFSKNLSSHVARGGSVATSENFIRAAKRLSVPADRSHRDLGFRCARDTPPLVIQK